MQKRGVSVSKLKTGRSTDIVRFIGVSLAGGKSDKACLAVLDYYPQEKKIFLSRLHEKIKTEGTISGDLKIHEFIKEYSENLHTVAFDVPMRLPECIMCQLEQRKKCPGYEVCKEPHIEWMWKHYHNHTKKKKPKKLFTPYVERCVELYFQTELDQVFHLQHALGSNTAPLLARAFFITHRLNVNIIEVFPKLSFHRIGESFGMLKSSLANHRAAFGGDESRESFIQILNEKNLAFIYHQDAKSMVENSHAFESFICAITAFLKYRGLTEPKPKKFPELEAWIEFPIKNVKL